MHVVFGLVLGALLSVAPAQGDVGFTGVWVRNVEKSDDPQEAMQEAMEQMREPMRGRERGGPPGGMGMPPGERPPRGGRPPGAAGGRPGGPPNFGGAADELDLELVDGELHVDDGERLRIYYLDGKEHAREMANGTKLATVAERKGNAIVIEEKMERGEIDRKFERSPNGAIMIMTVTMKMGRMKDPVVIKTVYERASETSSNE